MKLPVLPTLAAAFLVLGAPILVADDDEEKKEEPAPKDIRTFTAKNGKTIEARVLARLDDDRYKVETPKGKVFTLNIKNLSRSDQLFLEFWEPDAILDLAAAPLVEVMEKMEFSTAKMTATGINFYVTLSVNGTEGKFILNPGQAWSVMDPAFAKKLNVELGQGRINLNDANGNAARSQACTPETLSVGDVKLESPRFEVYSLSRAFNGLPAGMGGTLGADILPKLNAVVDYGGRQLFVRSKKK